MASSQILNLNIELYRGYRNTVFVCHDLYNKSLNYSDFIYCVARYSITDCHSLESESQSVVISAQSIVKKSMLSVVISAQSIVKKSMLSVVISAQSIVKKSMLSVVISAQYIVKKSMLSVVISAQSTVFDVNFP